MKTKLLGSYHLSDFTTDDSRLKSKIISWLMKSIIRSEMIYHPDATFGFIQFNEVLRFENRKEVKGKIKIYDNDIAKILNAEKTQNIMLLSNEIQNEMPIKRLAWYLLKCKDLQEKLCTENFNECWNCPAKELWNCDVNYKNCKKVLDEVV